MAGSEPHLDYYPKKKEGPVADWPDSLPGLDLNKALSQLGGKKTLYVRLLGMFNDVHTEDVNKLVAAAEACEWQQVYEINHALKGVTGNLAANELFDLCTEVDAKLKKDNHDLANELEAMPIAMTTLLTSISEAIQLPTE